jgi:hypothetical protein
MRRNEDRQELRNNHAEARKIGLRGCVVFPLLRREVNHAKAYAVAIHARTTQKHADTALDRFRRRSSTQHTLHWAWAGGSSELSCLILLAHPDQMLVRTFCWSAIDAEQRPRTDPRSRPKRPSAAAGGSQQAPVGGSKSASFAAVNRPPSKFS